MIREDGQEQYDVAPLRAAVQIKLDSGELTLSIIAERMDWLYETKRGPRADSARVARALGITMTTHGPRKNGSPGARYRLATIKEENAVAIMRAADIWP